MTHASRCSHWITWMQCSDFIPAGKMTMVGMYAAGTTYEVTGTLKTGGKVNLEIGDATTA